MDCEYSDGKGPTASQILEEQVSQLQMRIAELESINAAPLTLFDPYESFRRSQGGGALPSQQRNRTLHTLLCTFFHNSSSSGFFLHNPRFLQQVASPPSTGYPDHVTLLLNVICLTGAQFSTDAQMRTEQQASLSTVLNLLTPALSGCINIIYALQTEVLLTYYFFDNHRDMDRTYHWRAATSVVFACQLHCIRTSRPSSGGLTSTAQYQFGVPAGSLREGEQINAFWQDEAKGTVVNSTYPSAKAAILYGYASELAKTYNPNDPGSVTRFTYLDRGIDQLARDLPQMANVDPARPDVLRKLVTVHMIVHCATLQLHNTQYMLTVVADVILRGIMTLRSQNAVDMSNQAALLAPLSQILSAMDWWGVTSSLFRQQRVIVQNMLGQI
ncbi:hypothetical protein DAEQUDRAFT_786476 [Daedalea quercina L-15889]|uniref:Uncharacterized protein n=1 Tax=Daedalea quercina L-15889 TaxID=1314783 RepID=A0A165QBW1_9APHY|nr:hypothetical protein DAEQUDRAFT_786476 [Daedalea quercina L-15889]